MGKEEEEPTPGPRGKVWTSSEGFLYSVPLGRMTS